jgi:hypothetical protein
MEILMEPLFYNCNLQGDIGARISDPDDWMHKKRHKQMTKCTLLRHSPQLRTTADKYHQYTQKMAAAEITHVYHLLRGFEPGSSLRWMTHRELQQQCTDLNTALPCTEAHLQQLIRAMPK